MLNQREMQILEEKSSHTYRAARPTSKTADILPTPLSGERPTAYADRVGSWYVSTVTAEHRKKHGLYLTPVAVADFMAGLHGGEECNLRILDPAAGAGILLCALVEQAVECKKINALHISAYEIDEGLLPCLMATLAYLEKWCDSRGVKLDSNLIHGDFILDHSHNLRENGSLLSSQESCFYDVVVANPPYFKISKNDPRAVAASSVVHGQPNIYGLFMAVGASILKEGGELIFITPRSFASGQYFKAFREQFFALIRPETVHVFESRVDAFSRDEILQENIILKGVRQQQAYNGTAHVTISTSHGARDITAPTHRIVALSDILDKPKGMTLRLPVSDEESHLLNAVDAWQGSLKKYGLNISTGPVVPFRATELLDTSGDVPATHTPLLWMNHINAMHTEWPKRTKKPEYIKNEATARGLLVPNRNYVLLRRFSAKEEKRRLNASPYLAAEFAAPLVGLENHLNYIHRPEGELTVEEAIGLAALLNSGIMNRYYRVINGNTQVSATELRVLPLPPHETIIEIGRAISRYNGNAEAMLDNVVTDILCLPEFQKEREKEYA
jgi:adenine-specific DNA-methyltransferase